MASDSCAFCTRPVAANDRTMMREVQGWTKPRKQGGTNALKLQGDTGRVAHGECVEAVGRGVHPDQIALVW